MLALPYVYKCVSKCAIENVPISMSNMLTLLASSKIPLRSTALSLGFNALLFKQTMYTYKY